MRLLAASREVGSGHDPPARPIRPPRDQHPVVGVQGDTVMPRTEPFEVHHRQYEAWFEQHAAAYASELARRAKPGEDTPLSGVP